MDAGVTSTVNFRTASLALTLGIVACAALSLAAQKKAAESPGPVVFAQDKGKFTVKLGGQTVGHEEFEIAPSGGGWLAKGIAEIKPPEGGASKVSGSLTLQGARPFQQDLTFNSPLIAVLDNNLYHQYAVLARIYDWSKRGVQTFPVIIPQELTPGTITVQSAGSASADGKTYEGLKVTTSDLEILLLLDGNHRLMRLEVPDAAADSPADYHGHALAQAHSNGRYRCDRCHCHSPTRAAAAAPDYR